MATEEGVVFKMGSPEAGTVWVKTTRSSACASCSSKDVCNVGGEGKEMEMEVEAINTADARVGDRIVLNIKTGSLLKATFLLYVFPILAMIAGAVLGQTVAVMRGSDPSGLSALFGFLFFGLAFIVIRITGRRLSENTSYKPEIIKVRGRQSPSTDALVMPQTEL
ncbi:SoxR reducing system RseC family protein [uncultured Desulfosarcina sp.]|uniref:SoxR reducing system RseC family protein n=1 Tax=uncultured Desulfosarcina sp. TaxID=218289 RepID=UPI0029C7F2C6|nr:SoxR reducing system RseC family protein [uncultured Desulfosarcina sp.]